MTATFRPELVPTWARVAAWAVPLTTIPSIAWRMVSLLDGLIGGDDPCFGLGAPLWEKLYLLAVLPSVQLGLALLTVGLIRPWGEVFPRWMPVLGGRRVAVSFAVGAATTGAVLVGCGCGAAWSWTCWEAIERPRAPSRLDARSRAGTSCAGTRRCSCGRRCCWR
jgi:hypothetical protein